MVRKLAHEIFQKHGGKCFYCKRQCSKRDPRKSTHATVDHLVPVAKGGMTKDDNLVLACNACNAAKGALTYVEFRALIDYHTKHGAGIPWMRT